MSSLSARGVVAGALVVAAAVVCVLLGFWQLDRREQRRAFNDVGLTALRLPALDLAVAGADALLADDSKHLYRRAVARGTYDHSAEILLRGRAHDGRPGVHLVTPFRLADGGTTILVNRGWIPSPDAATADPRPFRSAGETVVEGILHLIPQAPAEAMPVRINADGHFVTTFRRLDRGTLSDTLGYPLPNLYLQKLPAGHPAGELPFPVAAPTFDEGPHLGYAIQWFSFAVIFLVGLGVLVRVRDRR